MRHGDALEAIFADWPAPAQPHARHGDVAEAIMVSNRARPPNGDELEAMLAMLHAARRAKIALSTSP